MKHPCYIEWENDKMRLTVWCNVVWEWMYELTNERICLFLSGPQTLPLCQRSYGECKPFSWVFAAFYTYGGTSNNGRIWTNYFVHCTEVVPSSMKVSFVWRLNMCMVFSIQSILIRDSLYSLIVYVTHWALGTIKGSLTIVVWPWCWEIAQILQYPSGKDLNCLKLNL